MFYDRSPRNVSVPEAQAIAQVAHPFVTLVGLFVDEDREKVQSILSSVPIQLAQFHGNESADYCESFGLPYIKAIRVGEQDDLTGQIAAYGSAHAILLDTYKAGTPGGTGEVFSWDLIPEMKQHLILAGGLTPENVAEAVKTVGPYAVDTSGGVESAPGAKDPAKMRAFISNVTSADRNVDV